jgi:hypothetical protein
MAGLIQYPGKPIDIAWDHKLTDGLVCALAIGNGSQQVGAGLVNLVYGELFTGTRRGGGYQSAIASVGHKPWMDLADGDFTIIFWKSGGGSLADWESILNIGGQSGITVQKNGSNAHMRVYINNNYQNIASFGTSEIEGAQCVAFTKSGLSNIYLYIDGAVDSNAAHNNEPSASGATASIGFADAVDTIYQVLIWDGRALAADEIAALWVDPHQVFQFATARGMIASPTSSSSSSSSQSSSSSSQSSSSSSQSSSSSSQSSSSSSSSQSSSSSSSSQSSSSSSSSQSSSSSSLSSLSSSSSSFSSSSSSSESSSSVSSSESSSSSSSYSFSSSSSSSVAPLQFPTLGKGVEFQIDEDVPDAGQWVSDADQGRRDVAVETYKAVHRHRLRIRYMSSADRRTLARFYLNTTVGSSRVFEWLHPMSGQLWLLRFDAERAPVWRRAERQPEKHHVDFAVIEEIADGYCLGIYDS